MKLLRICFPQRVTKGGIARPAAGSGGLGRMQRRARYARRHQQRSTDVGIEET